MNYNLLTYIIFFIVVAYVTIVVGWKFYKNGEHFIANLIPGDPHLVQSINRLLLIGYYLINLGYSAIIIYSWDEVRNVSEMINSTCTKAGIIIIGLGLIHYKNMLVLYLYKKYRNKILKINKQ